MNKLTEVMKKTNKVECQQIEQLLLVGMVHLSRETHVELIIFSRFICGRTRKCRSQEPRYTGAQIKYGVIK